MGFWAISLLQLLVPHSASASHSRWHSSLYKVSSVSAFSTELVIDIEAIDDERLPRKTRALLVDAIADVVFSSIQLNTAIPPGLVRVDL
jgi:hypothetical protein